MNTKLKIATSLILTGSLAFSPIGSLIQQNNNVVKANEKVSINSNIDIQKHINYIDSQIYLENNKLKINDTTNNIPILFKIFSVLLKRIELAKIDANIINNFIELSVIKTLVNIL